jgi:hypothetical protein
MPAPSQLHIATQVVQRLVKEEKSYYTELEGQKKRMEKLKADLASGANTDENAEFMLKQEVILLLSLLSSFLFLLILLPFTTSASATLQCS